MSLRRLLSCVYIAPNISDPSWAKVSTCEMNWSARISVTTSQKISSKETSVLFIVTLTFITKLQNFKGFIVQIFWATLISSCLTRACIAWKRRTQRTNVVKGSVRMLGEEFRIFVSKDADVNHGIRHTGPTKVQPISNRCGRNLAVEMFSHVTVGISPREVVCCYVVTLRFIFKS